MMLPESSNFFCSLHTTLTREQVAALFSSRGWRVRKCSWDEFEIVCDWAELVIEAESPTLMHGCVADVATRVEEIVAPIQAANVSFTAECCGTDGVLLREVES